MWLTANQPALFAYSAPAADGICAIERGDLRDGWLVISCIQVLGNPANSITNCAEYICAEVCEVFQIDVPELVWLENYGFFDRSEWKLIALTINDKWRPQDPVWTKMVAENWADLLKVSHHGSRGNTSQVFLETIAYRRFLLSTNGKLHGQPDREAKARLLKFARAGDKLVYFKYDTSRTKPWDNAALKAAHKYDT